MPYALCPMPYALCPMPYAQSYLIFLRKAIVSVYFDLTIPNIFTFICKVHSAHLAAISSASN
jgi:hypothetical protein